MQKSSEDFPSPDSTLSSDIESLELEPSIPRQASFSSASSSADLYKQEKLFLLCHGCVGVVMIQFARDCDLSTFRFFAKPGHSSLVLTTCRLCVLQRTYHPSRDFLSTPRLDEFFQILRLSPHMIEQMHAFQVAQVVARGKVLILTHEGGVAYESWNTLFRTLPGKSVCSGIETDMQQGLIRERLMMPHVPAVLM